MTILIHDAGAIYGVPWVASEGCEDVVKKSVEMAWLTIAGHRINPWVLR